MNKSDLSRNLYMLKGPLSKKGMTGGGTILQGITGLLVNLEHFS